MHRRSRQRFVPLAGVVPMVILVLVVLPSALNLPNTNPSTTLEYAPVPPSDENAPPVAGNLSSLNLASNSALTNDVGLPPQAGLPTRGKNPSTKRCIGNPPRQTEDLLSPPCVAFFEGNNFGNTYQGVTKDEIRVLFYFSGSACMSTTSRGCERHPQNDFRDLDQPPSADEMIYVRMLRLWQRYFNDRYQLYNRRLHLYTYFSQDADGTTPASPELRRADAVAMIQRVKPFAILSYPRAYSEDFMTAVAQRGVLNFASQYSRSSDFFSQFPGLIWSYLPSIEQQATTFADYVCTKIVPHKVSFSGNPGDNGKKRVLGLLSTTDPTKPEFGLFAKAARQKIMACGGRFAFEGKYPVAGSTTGTAGPDRPGTNNVADAGTNMAQFRQSGVTTIIWAQGYETDHSKAGARIGYRPEWVAAGDGQLEGVQATSFQDQSSFDGHAFSMVFTPLTPEVGRTQCYRSLKEADPNVPDADAGAICVYRTFYDDLRMFATGVQVAGPRLSPSSIDKGYHAIPEIRSKSPFVPACFFEPGDYTCIKDAAVSYWQSTKKVDPWPGCWQMALGGQRFFAGAWPKGDAPSMRRPATDPCNVFAGAASR